MANCKEDFLKESEGKEILCAKIEYGRSYFDESSEKTAILKVDYTPLEFKSFLSSINYQYDSGYGGQEVFGYIWYTDGTWSERCEYDGSEWWEYKQVPQIPDECK